MADYRLISLCNVSYKIVTKVLANRFKRVLDAVISPVQLAFIPNRAITDNIIIGHECLHHIHNQKSASSGLAALKLDLSKAFDRVEWPFIERLMLKFGFARDWIDLIMRCISSAKFPVLLNGVPTGSICPSRGLRQGNPLSPYLFVLCAQCLSMFLYGANAAGTLHGLSLTPTNPIVSHLLFADDGLSFLKLMSLNVCT